MNTTKKKKEYDYEPVVKNPNLEQFPRYAVPEARDLTPGSAAKPGTTAPTYTAPTYTAPAASAPKYTSPWSSQADQLMQQYMDRKPFQYDINQDALYQQYVDQYVKGGQLAMMDTMGQAQAMTGGYGNSYAQTAGQQAYQGYLGQLNNVVPELYQQALNRYMQEGDALAQQYAMLTDRESQDYSRYLDERNYQYQLGRDEIADRQWQEQMDEDRRRYDQEWEQKYGSKKKGGGGGGTGSGKTEEGLTAEERSMLALGYGPLTPDELATLIAEGEVVVETASDGTTRYKKTNSRGGGGGGPKRENAMQ